MANKKPGQPIFKKIKIGKDYKISKFNVIAYLMGGEQVWQEH